VKYNGYAMKKVTARNSANTCLLIKCVKRNGKQSGGNGVSMCGNVINGGNRNGVMCGKQ